MINKSPLTLCEHVERQFKNKIQSVTEINGEVTIEVPKENYLEVCSKLKFDDEFQFEQLIDLCAVDYSEYGHAEWDTENASSSGFLRAVDKDVEVKSHWKQCRFVVVLHLLSVTINQRIRVKTFAGDDNPLVPSITEVWNNANWYEREAFDLFGILFEGHNDLRRILTDYGFIGHPFRKDFPLIGNVEMRYDATEGRCIYEPVSIEPRVLVPRVIRKDQRFSDLNADSGEKDA